LVAPKYVDHPLQDLLISTGFLFWALSGVVSILRKEIYIVFFYFEGATAVVLGLAITLLNIGLASMPIIVKLTYK
jgi:hypothetical protein